MSTQLFNELDYFSLLNTIEEAIIIANHENIQFLNASAMMLLNINSIDEIRDTGFHNLFENNVSINQPYEIITLIRPGDKKKIEVEAQIRPFQNNGSQSYLITIRVDAPKKRIIQAELRANISERNNEKLRNELIERKNIEAKLQKSYNEITVLLKEVHHRVKNNLQIISSIVNFEKRKIKESQLTSTINNIQNRIQSIYIVHELMYKSNNFQQISFNNYITSLFDYLVRNYNYTFNNYTFNLEQVFLTLEVSIPLGMIMNELLNSFFEQMHLFKKNDYLKIELKKEGNYLHIAMLHPEFISESFTIEDFKKNMSKDILYGLIDQIGADFCESMENKRMSLFIKVKI